MATRQNSTNGKPKSPRIQVVLPENLCDQLALLAEEESRTVSNMAKVLIQKGIENYLELKGKPLLANSNTDQFRNKLEIMFKKIFAIYDNEYDLQLHYF